MKNEASKTRSLDIAFVVDAELLNRLAEILGETSDTLEYTVKYSDGTSVRYADMQEITGQPNSNQRSMVSLIAGTAGEKPKSAFVNLKKDDSPSLEYTVFGTQRDVIYFANQLDDWVAATRQWYSRFLSSEKTMSGGGALLFIAAIALPIYGLDRLTHFFPALGSKGPYGWLALPLLALMGFLEYLILRLFPRGTFAIGHGAKRHQVFVYVRNTVLGGLVLSVIASVLANWITKHL